jgi:hypothetical protein
MSATFAADSNASTAQILCGLVAFPALQGGSMTISPGSARRLYPQPAAGVEQNSAHSHSRAAALSRQLCVELQALTGNASSSVLLDILASRLRVGLRELEPALALGIESGWIERRADAVALREEGRQATLVRWPPREPLRVQSRFR